MLAHLTCVKLQKLACARAVARNFGMRTRANEHTRREKYTSRDHTWFATLHMWCTRHMRNVRHEITLGLPHYTCGVTTGTVAVSNEMQLFCS